MSQGDFIGNAAHGGHLSLSPSTRCASLRAAHDSDDMAVDADRRSDRSAYVVGKQVGKTKGVQSRICVGVIARIDRIVHEQFEERSEIALAQEHWSEQHPLRHAIEAADALQNALAVIELKRPRMGRPSMSRQTWCSAIGGPPSRLRSPPTLQQESRLRCSPRPRRPELSATGCRPLSMFLPRRSLHQVVPTRFGCNCSSIGGCKGGLRQCE
jgi:hypothetical protein